ncbi:MULTISPECIES: hypothetical protein [Burkholderia]|nr:MULTISPECIES: hypothetical protein [Burkholderia]
MNAPDAHPRARAIRHCSAIGAIAQIHLLHQSMQFPHEYRATVPAGPA